MIKIFHELIALYAEACSTPINDLPYVICNEQKQQETLASLTQLPENDKSTLHVGFSVWFNLDIICTTRPFYAAIFDIDPAVHSFIYPLLQSLILNSASKEEFISQFLKVINENENLEPFSVFLEDQFKLMQNNTHGFLASQDNFNYLKNMITEGRVFFGKANLTKQTDLLLIEQWIINNELDLKTLYLSNIPEWIVQQSKSTWDETQRNITKFIHPNMQLIDAFYPTTKKDGSGPPQRITQGELPSYTVRKAIRSVTSSPQMSTPKKSLRRLFIEQSKAQETKAQISTHKRRLSELLAAQITQEEQITQKNEYARKKKTPNTSFFASAQTSDNAQQSAKNGSSVGI
ncbi:LIC_10091 family protein [Legionella drancourtii]|uniref:DUF7790 domain-containing protein n=1 Tax=Legionella drancourtii LLAP12 TaxID=658187 RepID=G9ER05_9GAMM|nr:hypothetical protein [Legionella drancourtii]EHL30376.1 hypothetical protein LDG_7709 [Legionella drancourtii LLAP12]